MNNSKNSKMKIVLPVIIVLIVAGIWFVKGSNFTFNKDGGIGGDSISENVDLQLEAVEDLNLDTLKDYGMPIILDFGSATCPPCKKMAPELNNLHKRVYGKAIIKYIDVDLFQGLLSEYPVRVVPTQFFFDSEGKPYIPEDPEKYNMVVYNGKDTNEHVLTAHEGLLTEEQMMEILKELGVEE